MTYRYEDIDDERFQRLCSALVLESFPDLQCLPVGQPDGGRDSFSRSSKNPEERVIFQVKWTRDPRIHPDPVKWLAGVVSAESPNIERLAREGATRYVLLTNVPGTAHPRSGRIDKLSRELDRLSGKFQIEMACWWRDDLDVRLSRAPDELKWKYSEILTGPDAIRALIAGIQRKGAADQQDRLIRTIAATQWEDDKNVRFRQAGLDHPDLTELFVDVHLSSDGGQHSTRNLAREIESRGAASYLLSNAASRVVLRGAPGQGKSTLIQFVCQAHRALLLRKQDYLDRLPSPLRPDRGRIVFKVDLRDYARWISGLDPFAVNEADDRAARRPSGATSALESFLAHLMSRDSGGSAVTADEVRDIADRYPTLLALDGLDEVASERHRRTVVDEIQKTVSRFSLLNSDVQVVVTARPSYAKLAEPDEATFEFLELLPLDEGLRIQYLRRWSRVQNLDPRSRREVEKVFRARSAEPHVRELATNPMQLTILLFLIYQRADSVPRDRTKLYQDYMARFLDREASKDDNVNRYRPLLEQVTAYLGWHLQAVAEAGGDNGRLSLGALKREMRHFLVDNGQDAALVDILFHAATTRVWVLTSRVQGTFEFDVQSIREYFAAQHLALTAPPAGRQRADKFVRFVELALRPYWLNTARFMAGFFTPGELGGVVDELEQLREDEKSPFTSRRFIRALIVDGIFDGKPRALKRAIEVGHDRLGIRLLLQDIEDGVATPLSKERGGDYLVEVLKESLRIAPNLPRSYEIARLLSVHASSQELLEWWLVQVADLGGDALLEWVRLAAILRICSLLQPTTVAQIIKATEDRGIAQLLSGGADLSDPDHSHRAIRIVLDGDLIDLGADGRSTAADVARVFDPVRFLLMAANNQHAEDRVHCVPRLADPPRSLDRAVSRLRKASDWLDAVDAVRSRAGQRGTKSQWGNVARALEDRLGPNWVAREIALIGAAATTLRPGGDFTPGNSPLGSKSDLGMLIRQLSFHRRDVEWWAELIAIAESDLDKATCAVAFAACAPIEVVQVLTLQFSQLLGGLPRQVWRRVAGASYRLGNSGVARTFTLGDVNDLDSLSIRARLLIAHYVHLTSRWHFVVAGDGISQSNIEMAEPSLIQPVLESYINQEAGVGEGDRELFYDLARDAVSSLRLSEIVSSSLLSPRFHDISKIVDSPWAVLVAADRFFESRGQGSLLDLATTADWFSDGLD